MNFKKNNKTGPLKYYPKLADLLFNHPAKLKRFFPLELRDCLELNKKVNEIYQSQYYKNVRRQLSNKFSKISSMKFKFSNAKTFGKNHYILSYKDSNVKYDRLTNSILYELNLHVLNGDLNIIIDKNDFEKILNESKKILNESENFSKRVKKHLKKDLIYLNLGKFRFPKFLQTY